MTLADFGIFLVVAEVIRSRLGIQTTSYATKVILFENYPRLGSNFGVNGHEM